MILMTTEKRSKDAVLTDVHRAESAKLKELYTKAGHGLSQAAFGDKYGIGKQGAVWQCLNASGMPISLKAAHGFARGLGCSIGDFSPRLAELARTLSSVGTSDRVVQLSGSTTTGSVGSVRHTLNDLTQQLRAVDDGTRTAVAGLLGQYAQDPDANQKLLDAIGLLLEKPETS